MMKAFVLAALAISVGATGCEAPAPASPILSVLRRTTGCFALMTEDNEVPDELAVANQCEEASPPSLFAGVDLVEVVIDYGPDVDFAATTSPPAPTVAVSVDGTHLAIPVAISDEHRVGDRIYYLATFRAPSDPSTDVRIAAGVDSGFWTESPTIFAIVPPPVNFTIAECMAGMSCTHVAATGAIHAHVAVPGDAAGTVEIHATIDQIAQQAPIAIAETAQAGNASIADLVFDVPAHASSLVLTAHYGPAVSAPIAITLDPPTIIAALSCGANCTVARGASVGLTIHTPLDIHPAIAKVSTKIGGVPQLVNAEVAIEDGVAITTLVAPAQAVGSWQIDVSVAGYSAPTIEAYVQ